MTATDTTRRTATAENGNPDKPRADMKKQAPPDGIAISPAIGPLPPIYVPRPGEISSTGLLWHATAQAARRAGRWAARRLGNTTRRAGPRQGR
jgi:hypothetical protein